MRPVHNAAADSVAPFRPLASRPGPLTRQSSRPPAVERGTEDVGSSGFFAVDHRAWRAACRLGINEAICYLTLARGTLRDNRTTSWSINSIEHRTGISRRRLKAPIAALEAAGIVRRLNESEKHPRRFLVPGHQIGLLAINLPILTQDESDLFDNLPISTKPKLPIATLQIARGLKNKGYARQRGSLIEAVPELLEERDERPDWVWLPNSLVDPNGGKASPLEQIRQTQDPSLLRLFVDLYREHSLSFDGGVPTALLQKTYTRHKVTDLGTMTGWYFEHDSFSSAWEAPFYAAFMADSPACGNVRFFEAVDQLTKLGLVTFVEHLFESDDETAEILHPFAKPLPGRDVTEAEGRLYEAATRAGIALCGAGRPDPKHAIVPVPSHIKRVVMRGICRLRHRPHTVVTAEWMKRSDKWREHASYFDELARSLTPLAA